MQEQKELKQQLQECYCTKPENRWESCIAGVLLSMPLTFASKSFVPLWFFGTIGWVLDVSNNASEREQHCERLRKLLEAQNSATNASLGDNSNESSCCERLRKLLEAQNSATNASLGDNSNESS